MKNMFCVLALLAALLLAAGGGLAEDAARSDGEENVVALVNGEALLSSDYASMVSACCLQIAAAGGDLSDEATRAYAEDLALTAAIEDILVRQDMKAQGFYDFSGETEAWIVEQGNLAYESALAEVGEALRDSLQAGEEEDMSAYALAYAQILGVTAEDYIGVYRTETARVGYYAWLTQDWPVTDEDVENAFALQAQDGETLTQETRDALAGGIYAERCRLRLKERVDLLAESAEVVLCE